MSLRLPGTSTGRPSTKLLVVTTLCLAAPALAADNGLGDVLAVPPAPGPMLAQAASTPPATQAATQTPGAGAQEPDRRGLAAPFDSPPFPSSDFIGPVVGTRDTNGPYPVESLLKNVPIEDWLLKNGIRIYGWINGGISVSSSKHGNFPQTYSIVPNEPELDQFIFRIERVPDTVQTDHFDWGFRSTMMYGIDYRWTAAKGWWPGSQELLEHNDLYGWDPVEQYMLFYFPQIGDGTVLTVGRYISPPDIEAQLAPQNYLYTHSVFFDFDAYTYTGADAAIKLDDHWTALIGVHGGNDMAPWQDASQPNGQGLLRWVSGDNMDSLYGGISSLGSGVSRNNHDNLQQFNFTWTHKFTQQLHTTTEFYYMYQYDAQKGGTPSFGPVRFFGFGGGPGEVIHGRSEEWGAVNYLEYQLSKHDYVSFRNDFMDDEDGQRSGFNTTYSSWTLGLAHYFTDSNLLLRPEIRYERAWDANAYDLGTKRDQISFNMDFTIFY